MNLTTLFTELGLLLSLLNGQLDILKNAETKTELRNNIMTCESGGNPAAINENDKKITGYSSYGLFQFQFFTWFKYAKIYKVISSETTIEETKKLWRRPEYQGAVAHAMLNDGLYSHWKNCYEKYLESKKK